MENKENIDLIIPHNKINKVKALKNDKSIRMTIPFYICKLLNICKGDTLIVKIDSVNKKTILIYKDE